MSEDSIRRLVVFVATALVIALNQKLGLNLTGVELGALTALSAGYIGQSAVKSIMGSADAGNVSNPAALIGQAPPAAQELLGQMLAQVAGKVVAAVGDAAAAKVQTDKSAIDELKAG